MATRASPLILALAGVVSLTALILGAPTWSQLAIAGLICTLAFALAFTIRRHQPQSGQLWSVVGATTAMRGLGLFSELASGGRTTFSSALTHIGTVGCVLAFLGVARHKRARHDQHSSLDAVALALGGGLLAWQLGALVFDGIDRWALGLKLLQPLGAVAVAALAFEFAFTSRHAATTAYLTAASMTLLATSETIRALDPPAANPFGGSVPVALMTLALGTLAAAFARPDMTSLTTPELPPAATVIRMRGVLIVSALLVVPLTAVLHPSIDRAALLVVGSLMTATVLRRMRQLMFDLDRAQQATRTRDKRYRSLVQMSNDVLLVVSKDQRVQFASPAVETLLGYSSVEVLDRSLTDFIHTDDVDLIDPISEDASGRLVEVRLIHKDGSERWTEFGITDRTDDESVDGTVVNVRDIAERKLQQRALDVANRQREAVSALGKAVLAGDAPAELANLAVRRLVETLGLSSCELYRKISDGHTQLILESASGLLEPQVGQLVLTADHHSQAGYTLIAGDNVVASDFSEEQRFEESPELLALGITGGASVLVNGETANYGVLVAHVSDGRRFSPSDIDFMGDMATELALALERRRAEEETRHQALHDSLTGLPNRAMFLSRLELVTGTASPTDGSLIAVLFLDLDHFKLVNDSLGHDAGDELLIEVSSRLNAATRPTDTVARMGGDEFVVLCEDLTDVDQAARIADRVATKMEPQFNVGGKDLHVSASIGIAVTGATSDPDELLKDADVAMYKAKERGRGRYEVFDLTMREDAVEQLTIETELRNAISADELSLWYQPIVNLEDGATIGVEALVRWPLPNGEMRSPASFVPVAEASGMIKELGAWVFRQACQQQVEWTRLGHPIRVSINLSALQLNSDLPALLQTIIADTGVDPAMLSLELTESAVMGDVERSMELLQALRELGPSISIDDFGTGYSSLAYLRRLPVDVLKIDRAFITDLGGNAEDDAIVKAVISLAKTLGLKTVAEGVETATVYDLLTELGCDYAQGYLMGKPVPAAELV